MLYLSYGWSIVQHCAPSGKLWRDIIPVGHRPKIILGEAGSSKATVATLGGRHGQPGPGGIDAIIWDINGYQKRLVNDPLYVGFCYWTLGGSRGYGFDYSTIDVPESKRMERLYEWLVSQKHRWSREATKLAA